MTVQEILHKQAVDSLPETGAAYRMCFDRTGETYIGSSVNLRQRIKRHVHLMTIREKCNRHFYRLATAYGPRCFTVEILDLCDNAIGLLCLEKFWGLMLKPSLNISGVRPFRDLTLRRREKAMAQ